MSDSTKDSSRSVTKFLGGRPSSPLARKLAERVCHHAADGIPSLDLVADLVGAGLSRIEAAAIVACHASAPAKSVRALLANACALACPADRDVVHGVHHEMLAAIAVIKAAGEDAADFWIEVRERAEDSAQRDVEPLRRRRREMKRWRSCAPSCASICALRRLA